MFGTSDGEDAGGGLIDYSDGWIADPSTSLLLDVVTPHQGAYYMESKEPVPEPTDFDSPIPVPFLAVKGMFFIVISTRDSRIPDQWPDRAEKRVEQSLPNWGIGGKTNADYGRMALKSVKIAADANAASVVLPNQPAVASMTNSAVTLHQNVEVIIRDFNSGLLEN